MDIRCKATNGTCVICNVKESNIFFCHCCEQKVCDDCMSNSACEICITFTCRACENRCTGCKKIFCNDCSNLDRFTEKCDDCEALYCMNCINAFVYTICVPCTDKREDIHRKFKSDFIENQIFKQIYSHIKPFM